MIRGNLILLFGGIQYISLQYKFEKRFGFYKVDKEVSFFDGRLGNEYWYGVIIGLQVSEDSWVE